MQNYHVNKGQEDAARHLHANFSQVFLHFGGLPEMFSTDGTKIHPQGRGYPLRPELMESTYMLHSVTEDPYFLQVGEQYIRSLM